MPAGYAHYRFGKLLLPELPPDVRQCIQRFRRMYDMGLQGPDFFFYHGVFLKTATGELGSAFHRQTGQIFFPVACKAVTSDAAKAYFYGLLGHYCLDSICHPFVHQLVEIDEAKHVPLESELERYLLTLDGEVSPHTFDMSRHFRLTRGECMSVAAFYPGSTGGMVSQCVHLMALFTRFLSHPNRERLLRLLLKYKPSIREHMIPEEENPALAPYVLELGELFNQALERYPTLLRQITAHMETGDALGQDFAANFG